MGNSGRTGRYSEDAVSTRCGFFRLFLFFLRFRYLLVFGFVHQTEKFFFVLCVDQALAEIVVHQQDAQAPQNVQMDIVLRVRRGDQEEQFGRFAVQGVKVHAVADDDHGKARAFDRFGFRVGNGDPLANSCGTDGFTL